ncbi:hypothetical protein BC629DRAFT_1482619 [Irpex lacteus]|nr:hypothetical protein BC629DRAFT_1482619 [Irpex lacteus]
MNSSIIDNVLASLHSHSLAQVIMELMFNSRYENSAHQQLFVAQWPSLLEHLAYHPLLQKDTAHFVSTSMTKQLTSEVSCLVQKESGWHFSAKNVTADQLEHFAIDGMADRMQEQAPTLSTLLGCLLSSGPNRTTNRERATQEEVADEDLGATAEAVAELDEDEEYWLGDEVNIEEPPNGSVETDADVLMLEEEDGSGDGSARGEEQRTARLRKRRV